MAADNTRQASKAGSTRTQIGKSSVARNAATASADPVVPSRLKQLGIELLGAIEDHRKWINSDRARALETAFAVAGRLLAYAAYIALAYLAFDSFVAIRSGLTAGIYAIPEHTDGSRVALFTILATGLVGPIAIILIGVGIGWIYNLTTAAANRLFPRFVQPLVHPSILFSLVAAFAAFHAAVTATVASGYFYAKVNIEAASPQEAVSIKVIEIPNRDDPEAPEEIARDAPSERELVRLRSMFSSGQPCVQDTQGKELKPQDVDARPEPGLAPGRDCPETKTPVRE